MRRRPLLWFVALLLSLTPLASQSSQSQSPRSPAGGSAGVVRGPAATPRAANSATQGYLPLVLTGWHAPSSDQLIDQALAAGQIVTETALIYKVFAAVSDPRLPAAYRGDDRWVLESHAVDQVAAQWNSLSP